MIDGAAPVPLRDVSFNRLPRALREEITRLTRAAPCIASTHDNGTWVGFVIASLAAAVLVETRTFGTRLSIGDAVNWVPLWLGTAAALAVRFGFSVPYVPGVYVFPAWVMVARWDGRVQLYEVGAPDVSSMRSGKRLQHYEGERVRFAVAGRVAERVVISTMVGGDRTPRSAELVRAKVSELLRPIADYRDARARRDLSAMAALDPLAAWSHLPQWEGAEDASGPRARPAPGWLLRGIRPIAVFVIVWPALVLVATLIAPPSPPAPSALGSPRGAVDSARPAPRRRSRRPRRPRRRERSALPTWTDGCARSGRRSRRPGDLR